MSDLISIWKKHAFDEAFGEFIVMAVRHHEDIVHEPDTEFEAIMPLENASPGDLTQWARERFGIEK